MLATFHHAEQSARGIVTLYFAPPTPVRYTAGQFTELYLPHAAADNRGERRWFTLSSSPTESLLAITTRLTAGGSSTYKRALGALTPGQELHLAELMGDFVLPKDPHIPLVFVAAGLGITPVRSMVRYLHDMGEKRDIQLLYAASQADEMPFLDLFTAYPLAVTQLAKHSSPEYHGETGSVTLSRILRMIQGKAEPYIYLSGPEPLVEQLYKELIAHGIPNERLLTDYFPGYQAF